MTALHEPDVPPDCAPSSGGDELADDDFVLDFGEPLPEMPSEWVPPPEAVITEEPTSPHDARELGDVTGPLMMARVEAPGAPTPFHGLAGEIVAVLKPHTEADPVAVLAHLLIGFGNCLGRAAHFRVENDYHYTNEFVVLVGPTGEGRKGVSAGRGLQAIEAVDREYVETRVTHGGLSSGEGVIWQVRDPIVKLERDKKERDKKMDETREVVVDPGVEDRRLLVLESEFATALRVFQREGNTLSAVLRNFWDRGTVQSLTKNSPAKTTGALLSIIGHITPEEFTRYLSVTEMANGLLNRFLILSVRRSQLLPFGGESEPPGLQPLIGELHRAVEHGRTPREVGLTPAARQLWAHELYPALNAERHGLVGALTARAAPHVRRLALLYALLDLAHDVDVPHLNAAAALWELSERSVQQIFGRRTGEPDADRLLVAVERAAAAGLTETQQSHVFGRNLQAARLDRARLTVMRSGFVEVVRMTTPGGHRETDIMRWKDTGL